jgi:predicted HicB family RNase H-like nuclease
LADSQAEALSQLDEIAEGWLEAAIARGQPIPEPLEENEYSGKFILRLSKSVHQKAALAAKRDGVSLNQFISNCVAEQVGARAVTLPTNMNISGYTLPVVTKTGAITGKVVGGGASLIFHDPQWESHIESELDTGATILSTGPLPFWSRE